MSLFKQFLFAEDAFSQLPNLINMIQTTTFPDSALTEIFPNISTLIYGTYTERKIGLAVLKCCLLYLHKTNKISENNDHILKWWKGVVNAMKSRYTPDSTYRLACTNAIILSQISPNFVELQMETRYNVPAMVSGCVSHLCRESFDLLVVLAKFYPTHVGKHYEEVKTFCLSHVHDEFNLKSADLFGKLSCVGPAGRQSQNYVQSWNKMIINTLGNIRQLVQCVMTEPADSPSNHILKSWAFSGTLESIVKANNEMTFLVNCVKSLLTISLDAQLIFPLKLLKSLVEMVQTAYSETIIFVSTTENLSKKYFVKHSIGEFLDLLISIVPVLNSTTFLIQTKIESLCSLLLQQNANVSQILKLITTMVDVGCSLSSIPFVSLLELLSINNYHTTGPVTKKQKTQQFNTFSFETSTLGYHHEDQMVVVLSILSQILRNSGANLPSLKIAVLKKKCDDIVQNKNHFSRRVVEAAYETQLTISTQTFDLNAVFSLCGRSKDTAHKTFFNNKIIDVEPHMHPERYSFRNIERDTEVPNGNTVSQPKTMTMNGWDVEKENTSIFLNMPHSKISAGTKEDTEMEEGEEKEDESEDESSNEMETDLIGDSSLLENIKSQFEKVKEVPANVQRDQDKDIASTVPAPPPSFTDVDSNNLQEILASFVEDPPSGEES